MITAILVDDEEKSLKNLELLLAEACPAVRIVDKATNALEAVKCILSADPDLVFLDVHMPGYNGFDVLDSIRGSGTTVSMCSTASGGRAPLWCSPRLIRTTPSTP